MNLQGEDVNLQGSLHALSINDYDEYSFEQRRGRSPILCSADSDFLAFDLRQIPKHSSRFSGSMFSCISQLISSASVKCACTLGSLKVDVDRRVLAKLSTTSLLILQLMKSNSMPVNVNVGPPPTTLPHPLPEFAIRQPLTDTSTFEWPEPEGELV